MLNSKPVLWIRIDPDELYEELYALQLSLRSRQVNGATAVAVATIEVQTTEVASEERFHAKSGGNNL